MLGDDHKLRKQVADSFKNAKQDIEALKIHSALLETENKELRETVGRLVEALEHREKEQSQKSLSEDKLRQIFKEIISEELQIENTKAAESLSAETNMIEEWEPPITPAAEQPLRTRQDRLKEDLVRKFERHRKDIIKQQILTEAQTSSKTKAELRNIVVKEKKYCSKASFYRYMEELELTQQITYRRHKQRTIIEPLLISKA